MLHHYKLLFLVSGLALLASCGYDNADDLKPATECDAPDVVSYAQHISPLLERNCRSCHNAALLTANVNLEPYAEVYSRAASGLLLGVVSHAPGYKQMPYNGAKLSDCDIALLQKWVTAGAPNN